MGLVLWWRSRKKVLITLLLVVGAAGVVALAPESLRERMSTIQHYDEDASAMSRIEIWLAGLQIVAERPLVGGGFRATHSQAVIDKYAPGAHSRAVHNSHLEILIENGVFAFLCHLGLIGSVVVYTTRIMRVSRGVAELSWAYDLAAMLQASLVAYLVGGSFLSLAYYDGWWYLPMIAAATYRVVMQQAPDRRFVAPLAVPARGGA
jgi:probable O-glycosylation ligase (exosortase A-associated)